LSPISSQGESISLSADTCPSSNIQGGSRLSAGLGANQAETFAINFWEGTTLTGRLSDGDRGVADASICVYSRVTTESHADLLGFLTTDQNGRYAITVPPGPSRTLTAVHKNEEGQIEAWTLLQSRAAPTLQIQDNVIRNKNFAYFSGEIPGPDNDGMVVVLQVRSGKGWLVFRRYVTREGGKFSMRYRFFRALQPTTYTMRAQVLGAPGYPSLEGNSAERSLHVLPLRGPRPITPIT
jgi:hypothetical protein